MDLPTKIDFAKVNCRPQLDRANAAVADVWSACGSRFPRPGYRDFHVPAWLPRLSVAIPPGTPDLIPATGTEDRMAGWA